MPRDTADLRGPEAVLDVIKLELPLDPYLRALADQLAPMYRVERGSY